MWKILIFIGAAYVVYLLFRGDRKLKGTKAKEEQAKMAASGEMVRDPACGTYVPKDGNIRVRQGETVHVFCSYECRDKFIKSLEGDEAPKS